jgi:hypothetical protein
VTTISEGVPNRPTECVAEAQAQVGTAEQRCADAANAREFQRIQQSAAACRRQWPGAMIVLRPDGAPTGANAPPNPETGIRS